MAFKKDKTQFESDRKLTQKTEENFQKIKTRATKTVTKEQKNSILAIK